MRGRQRQENRRPFHRAQASATTLRSFQTLTKTLAQLTTTRNLPYAPQTIKDNP